MPAHARSRFSQISVQSQISLGFGLSAKEKKPKVLLNRNATKEENVSWNAAIFKIAVIQEE